MLHHLMTSGWSTMTKRIVGITSVIVIALTFLYVNGAIDSEGLEKGKKIYQIMTHGGQ